MRRAWLRSRLMDLNPITWLASRERWQAASFWALSGLLVVGLVIIVTVSRVPSQFWAFVSGMLSILLYLAFAGQSPRFFADARKNGLLELLLSTPLTSRSIIEGQWKATLRLFGWPIALFTVVNFIGSFIDHQSAPNANGLASFGTAAAGVLVIPFDLAALAWFGMWMGLISKSVNSAAWKTVLFGIGLPVLLILLVMPAMLFFLNPPFFRAASPPWIEFIQTAFPAAGSLAIDLGLYIFARRRLFTQLRERAAIT